MAASPSSDHKLDARLSRLEATVEQVVSAVDVLATKVDKLTTSRIDSAKTQWGPILTACGLVLALVSGVGGLVLSGVRGDIGRLEAFEAARREYELENARLRGGLEVWRSSTSKEILNLNDVLQREIKGTTDRLSTQLESLSDRQHKHESSGGHAAMNERMKAVERAVFSGDKP